MSERENNPTKWQKTAEGQQGCLKKRENPATGGWHTHFIIFMYILVVVVIVLKLGKASTIIF